MASLIRSFDWAATPLGALSGWPQSLKTATGMLTNASVPMVMLWGVDGVMIYNDAYSVFAGRRHPQLLGSNVREGWDEVADFNDNVMRVCLAGDTLTYRDQELVLNRTGAPETIWADLDYWPVPGEDGDPAGVIATVIETTSRVMAGRRAGALQERQRQMLQQMPGFVGMLSGPEHRFEYVNDAYVEVSGDRDFLGRTVREVFPDLKGQGFYERLDRVHQTGERYIARGLPIHLDRPDGDRFIDLLYEPIRDGRGQVSGIFVGGYDVTEIHQATGALADSETRYRTLFEAITSGFCIIEMKFDGDGRPVDYMIVEGNAAFAEMTGLHDANGKWVSEIAPGLEQHWFDLYGRVALTGEPARFENPAEIFGRWYDVEALRIGDPEARRVAILFTNITERKRLEARQTALIELNDALRDLTDPDAIAQASAEVVARALGVSRAGYGDVDTEAETITIHRDFNGPGVQSIAGTLLFRQHGSYIEDIKRGETVAIADVALDPRTRDTADVLTNISAASFINMPLVEHGRVVAMIFVNNAVPRVWSQADVDLLHEVAQRVRAASERARSEAALRESETRYRALFDTMDEGFCIIEFVDGPEGPLSDYVHVEANPAYEAQAGIPQVVGQKVRAMVGDEAQGWIDLYSGVLKTGVPIRFERELEKTGRWLELSAFRVEPTGRNQVAVLFQDLTARKTAEIALQELNATLEDRVAERTEELTAAHEALRQSQKMEAVGQLTGGIAHDFNNLLAGISGSLELLEKRMHEGRLAGMERYISAAQGAARRAAALTQRLLAFSRRQTLDPRPTDVNRLINGMEELIRRSVGPDVEVEVVGAGGLWATRIDASQLENALLNLCINARDAMAPSGGRLTIETANKWLDDRAARDRDLPPGQYVSLCVSDTGTGMTPEVIRQAFDPFFTTKPLGQGTGLGLSMIHGFVRQSGGQVRIYSEIGKGTTMCLYLPRDAGGLEEPEPDIPTLGPEAGHGETVLVIDDEATVRMLIVEVMEDAGYIVMEADDGPSGLRILQSDVRIDLLITDVGLPGGMNGRQVADAARESRPNLKILFVTGYAENAAVGNGHLEPGMEVITKPFAMSALGEKVREMIER